MILVSVLMLNVASEPPKSLHQPAARKKYAVSTFATFTSTPIRVESVDLDLPEGSLVNDLNVEVADEVDFTSSILGVSASYFPLPIWEVSLSAGLVSLESESDIRATGTLAVESSFLPSSFDVSAAPTRESEGVGYGVGTAVYVPLTNLRGNPVIARAGMHLGVNDVDDNRTETLNANVTVINAQRIANREITFALGATYIQIDREIDTSVLLGGQELDVSLTQGIDNPWAMTSSLIAPLNDSVNVSFSATNNFDGLNSYGLRLGYRF